MRARRTLALATALAVAAASRPAPADWINQSYLADQDTQYTTIAASGPTHACAAGFTSAGGQNQPIYACTVDGEIWSPGSTGGLYFLDMTFVDAHVGFAGAMLAGNVYRTDDGGISWQAVPEASPGGAFEFVSVIASSEDGETVWAVASTGEARYSRDRGGTWQAATLPAPDGEGQYIYAVSILGENVWVAGGDGGQAEGEDEWGEPIPGRPAGSGWVLGSSDGGATFEVLVQGLPYAVLGVDFASADQGWLAGGTKEEGGAIVGATFDGGHTWETSRPPDLPEPEVAGAGMGASLAPASCQAVSFFGPEVGLALCTTATLEYQGTPALYLSQDGGDTWAHQAGYLGAMPGPLAAGMAIYDAAFADCHRMWVAGQGKIVNRWSNPDQGMDCRAGGAAGGAGDAEGTDEGEAAREDDCGCAAPGRAPGPSTAIGAIAALLLSLP